jgi:hypothetical protein
LKIYFAAVGSDLWEHHVRALHGATQRVLFSYFDLEHGGFQFRRKSWELATGIPYERGKLNGTNGKERLAGDTPSS